MALTNKQIKNLNKIMPGFKIGNFLASLENASGITALSILLGKLKVVNRDLVVAIGASSATVTTAADINGTPLAPFFTAASPDATATEIRSVRFVPSTGALTVTLNANATAATTVRVPILQAA